jgi:hypothetical protein
VARDLVAKGSVFEVRRLLMKECSAVGNAEFKVYFSSNWRAETHPKQYPGRDAAFEDVSLAVHSASSSFFSPGMIAEAKAVVGKHDEHDKTAPGYETMRVACPQAGV